MASGMVDDVAEEEEAWHSDTECCSIDDEEEEEEERELRDREHLRLRGHFVYLVSPAASGRPSHPKRSVRKGDRLWDPVVGEGIRQAAADRGGGPLFADISPI